MKRLTRRRVLQSAAAGSAGLAGCLGGSGGSTDSSGSDDSTDDSTDGSGGSTDSSGSDDSTDDSTDSSPQASTASQGAGGLALDGRELEVTEEIPNMAIREVAFDGKEYLKVAVANTGNTDLEFGAGYLIANFYSEDGDKLNTYEKEASTTSIEAGGTDTVRIRLFVDPERVDRIARVELRMTCVDTFGEGIPYCSN